ncbi:serine--tRNA synthetase-like protein Slimp [Phlebotomus argentipes]|uniref:serine--tRNA synthetase-like protein Slimp n=1 Tax=Phlebotomus argentipes TaxID=94469 RepID=UPI002892D310|nr:serine--tRNA synthetase-like protein Slimp [Phlebotomus argentipes]
MILRRLSISVSSQMRQFSALYLTGDKAREEYASVHPYMDFRGVLGDKKALQDNLMKRKSSVDINKLYSQWKEYESLQERLHSLEEKRTEIANTLKQQYKNLEKEEIEKLKAEGKNVRNSLTKLKDNSYGFEEEFINIFLQVPNVIHPRVKDEVLHTFLNKEKSSAPGKLADDINLYTTGNLARFEFVFPNYCQRIFKEKGYEFFSNPDFVRSVIVEAAGVDKNRLFQVLEEEDNKINLLHLSGGGTMLSFLSFIARLTVFSTQLPLAFVANGKCYTPKHEQGNSVQLFYASGNCAEAEERFNEIMRNLKEIYEKLGNHFRIINVVPEHLDSSEMMRVSLQMHSSSRDAYVEIANVSLHGDYISKRLLFNYKIGKTFMFPHIVTATVVNIAELRKILLEQPEPNVENLLNLCKVNN